VGAVGRAAGVADGQERQEGRDEVEAGMRGFGQDSEASGEQSDDGLERRQRDRGGQRRERSESFLALAAL
jgi:hypothetical protein